MKIADAQILVDKWIREKGVRYFNELTNMTLLVEEVGEMARIIARKYGEQSYKEGEDNLNLAEEMGDVLFVLICIANQTQTDLTKSLEKSIEKKTFRDKNRHINNPKLA
jgi:NTP pyrophosphatase (non-canonical NTP hydrolase)